MSRDTTVIALRQPETIDDPLSELAREGARRMLAQVLIAEADFLCRYVEGLEITGWPRPHRASWPWAASCNPDRVGPVEVRRAKVRDRGDVGAEEKIRVTSSILPKWARRTRRIRCAIAGSLPAWGIDRRLPGGAHWARTRRTSRRP